MNCSGTISIKDRFGLSLHTRETATKLMNLVQANLCKSVELDFNQVEFLSRSFADQLQKEIIKCWERKNIKVTVANANMHIIAMLQYVANTQDLDVRKKDYIPRYKFSNPIELEEFLMDI